MWLDAIVFALLALFGWFGARKGAAESAMGVATLVVGYGAAIEAGTAVGPALASGLGIPELAGIPLAGSVAFALAFAAMAYATRVVRERFEHRNRSPRDRFVGGAFGVIRGAFIALLISYLALWVDALRITGHPDLPELGPSAAAAVTEAVVVAGVETGLADSGPAARAVARMAGRPAAALGELRDVLESEHIANLQGDRAFWTYVEAGSIDAALNQRSFLAMSRDIAFRHQLAACGLISEAQAIDWEEFRQAAYELFAQVGPRIHGLREDPQLRELLDDPDVVAMVESGDTFGLVGHAGFRTLVAQVVSGPSQSD